MEHIHRLIHDIYLLLDSGDTRVFGRFDLTTTQYRTLMLLDEQIGKALTTLADQLFRSRSTATRLIDRLEQRNLVSRADDPNDRRIQYIFLSPQGVEIRNTVHQAHLDSLNARFGNLSAADLNHFSDLMTKLRNNLQTELDQNTSATSREWR